MDLTYPGYFRILLRMDATTFLAVVVLSVVYLVTVYVLTRALDREQERGVANEKRWREMWMAADQLAHTALRDLAAVRDQEVARIERIAGFEAPPQPADYGEQMDPRAFERTLEMKPADRAVAGVPGRWGMPEEPDAATFDDPNDLSNPLDQLPPEDDEAFWSDTPPEGDMAWGIDEPVPLPEPVPESGRQGTAWIAPGENPYEELGLSMPGRGE